MSTLDPDGCRSTLPESLSAWVLWHERNTLVLLLLLGLRNGPQGLLLNSPLLSANLIGQLRYYSYNTL
jgi:hypothetical protein